MRVIRHESGWDIALDMVFADKITAAIIAERIQHAVHALILDAVDASMCGRTNAKDAREKIVPATVGGQSAAPQPQQERLRTSPEHYCSDDFSLTR